MFPEEWKIELNNHPVWYFFQITEPRHLSMQSDWYVILCPTFSHRTI